MIKNTDNLKYKIQANNVMVDNINIVDYINNKIVKLQNDIVTYASYRCGIYVDSSTMTINGTEYTKVPLTPNNRFIGNTDVFEVVGNQIVYKGTTQGQNLPVRIMATCELRSNSFDSGSVIWGKIRVENPDGSMKNESYMTQSVISTSSRNRFVGFLDSYIWKGDKISFELEYDREITLNVGKICIDVDAQFTVPTEYYDLEI